MNALRLQGPATRPMSKFDGRDTAVDESEGEEEAEGALPTGAPARGDDGRSSPPWIVRSPGSLHVALHGQGPVSQSSRSIDGMPLRDLAISSFTLKCRHSLASDHAVI